MLLRRVMKYLLFSILLNVIFVSGINAGDFRNLKWGMTQHDVVSLNGHPETATPNKIIYGTMTQTYTYKDSENDITYDLLFLENQLSNASYKISATKKAPANYVQKKYREETVILEEKFEEPPIVEKMDNSTRKYTYENSNTKVMVIYYNTPIKADYVNRSAYLNVTYSNADPVLKAEIKNRKISRIKASQ